MYINLKNQKEEVYLGLGYGSMMEVSLPCSQLLSWTYLSG